MSATHYPQNTILTTETPILPSKTTLKKQKSPYHFVRGSSTGTPARGPSRAAAKRKGPCRPIPSAGLRRQIATLPVPRSDGLVGDRIKSRERVPSKEFPDEYGCVLFTGPFK